MWPPRLKRRLILFCIEQRIGILMYRRQGSKDIRRHHGDHILHYGFVEAIACVVHVLHDFQQRLALGLLLFHAVRPVEVVGPRASLQLSLKKRRPLRHRGFPQRRHPSKRVVIRSTFLFVVGRRGLGSSSSAIGAGICPC